MSALGENLVDDVDFEGRTRDSLVAGVFELREDMTLNFAKPYA